MGQWLSWLIFKPDPLKVHVTEPIIEPSHGSKSDQLDLIDILGHLGSFFGTQMSILGSRTFSFQ
jgi:hypothetical protein